MRVLDRIGNKYHQLLIISVAYTKKNRVFANTLCDCGKEKIICIDNIVRNIKPTKSCGHLFWENLNSFKNTKPNYIAEYSRWQTQNTGAARRNIETSLTLEEYIKLISGDCFYCGSAPDQSMHNSSAFCKNGIDRLDSNIGYHVSNCVSACKQCNLAKQSTPIADFLAWIKKVNAHLFTT